MRAIQKFPNHSVLNDNDLQLVRLQERLRPLLETFQDAFINRFNSRDSDHTYLRVAQLITLAAASLQVPPGILFSKIALRKSRPYWTSYYLHELFQDAEYKSLLDESLEVFLKEIAEIEQQMKILTGN